MLKSLFCLCTVATLVSGHVFATEIKAVDPIIQTEIKTETQLADCGACKAKKKKKLPEAEAVKVATTITIPADEEVKVEIKLACKRDVKDGGEPEAPLACKRHKKMKVVPVKAEEAVACSSCGGRGRDRDRLAHAPVVTEDGKVVEQEVKLVA